MKKAWADFWERYKDHFGKTSRSEYWFVAGIELLMIVFLISIDPIVNFISRESSYDFHVIARILSITWLFLLTFIVPNFSLNVRRFNDVGFSHGLSSLLAFLGYAMIIVGLFCKFTNSSGNGFVLLMFAGDVLLMLIAALPTNIFKSKTISKIN